TWVLAAPSTPRRVRQTGAPTADAWPRDEKSTRPPCSGDSVNRATPCASVRALCCIPAPRARTTTLTSGLPSRFRAVTRTIDDRRLSSNRGAAVSVLHLIAGSGGV